MNILIVLAIISTLILLYAIEGRAWLKRQPWAKGFFDWVEPIEIALFKKSETILFARLLSALGIVLTFLTQIGDINLTPLMPLVPDKYQVIVSMTINCIPLAISFIGMIVEWLRKKTTKPVELVAVPEDKLPPSAALAVAQAEVAKEQAVAAVTEAKVA
ncbi:MULTISPECIES: hypothetical protein [unclassified Bradyrhizobium]